MSRIVNRRIASVALFLALTAGISPALAAPPADNAPSVDKSTGFSLGFDVNSVANDLGIGLYAASPDFYYDIFHFQLSAAIAWARGIQSGQSTQTWLPFGLYKVGFCSGRFIPDVPIRVYGCGGLAIVGPSPGISQSSVSFGGFGSSTVEFFVNRAKSKSLALEMGALGTSAIADKLSGSPSFANGFTIGWGYHYYF